MKKYVVGFMFNATRTKVLLIEKLKPEWQAGKLNGIGGKIEEGEEPLAAMYREFEEETGMDDLAIWKRFCVLGDNLDYAVHCFFSFGDITKAKQVESEKPIICYLNSLPHDKIIPNLKWLIPMALDSVILMARISTRQEVYYSPANSTLKGDSE